MKARTSLDVESLLARVGVTSLSIHVVLLAYSLLVSRSIAGIDLWYLESRFSAGGDNPHYVSLVVLAAIFIVVRSIIRTSSWRNRFALVLLCAGGIGVAISTGSTTILAASLVSVACLLLIKLLGAGKSGFVWFLLLFICVLALAFAGWIQAAAVRMVEGDANGQGRIDIWSTYSQTFQLSPLFGLGPGAHALGGGTEYHNVFIEIAAMAGLSGLIVVIGFLAISIMGAARVDTLLAGPVLAVTFYGVGGFSARRLVFWVVLALVVSIVRQSRSNTPGVPEFGHRSRKSAERAGARRDSSLEAS